MPELGQYRRGDRHRRLAPRVERRGNANSHRRDRRVAPPRSRVNLPVMAQLRIDLQDGFQDDDVVVKVDGEERLRQAGVTTKKVLGLAGSVTVDVPEGQRSIELSVPSRGV